MTSIETILDRIVELERNKAGATKLVLGPITYAMLLEALGYDPIDKDISIYHGLEICIDLNDEAIVEVL